MPRTIRNDAALTVRRHVGLRHKVAPRFLPRSFYTVPRIEVPVAFENVQVRQDFLVDAIHFPPHKILDRRIILVPDQPGEVAAGICQ